MQLATFVAAALSLASSVSAHGYLKYIDYAGVRYPAWQVGQDDFLTPIPTRFSRRIKDNGPVPDFTSKDITCNLGGNLPTDALIPVTPGSQIKFVWDQWGSSHSGPVMTYLAKCSPNCASFKGDSGAVWVKIDQMGWDNASSPKWASDKLATLGASWTVTIPPGLADGEYLIRHEILGLHVAGARMGAQFYPSCAALKVSGGGATQLPSGVALPGAYDPADAGILVELWRIGTLIHSYTPPGGPVWSGAGAQLNGAGNVPAPTRTATWTGGLPTSPATSSVVVPPTSTSAVRTTSSSAVRTTSTSVPPVVTPTTVPGTVAQWGQCGGIGYTGPTGCVAPYKCTKVNDYYSQCLA